MRQRHSDGVGASVQLGDDIDPYLPSSVALHPKSIDSARCAAPLVLLCPFAYLVTQNVIYSLLLFIGTSKDWNMDQICYQSAI
ncbi:hypothetical protein Ddc_06476 [Ditylenchus destructor]|nr:hypothetical protein Ddc_06476 [Ditylenchus destructor]